jgi:YidC/Oxa1 family membrane protein insertase
MNILYTIVIYPIAQIIETVFVFVCKISDDYGLAIIGVSAAVTVLCLPLYVIAEKWQRFERDTQRRLAPKIRRIKEVFSGDEQYMILSTYYRQNHYHPVYALRNSFGILIQIPFFIAAYSYLSHLEVLRGTQFFFIRDMSAPDALLNLGAFQINVLPVLMTFINCISGAIYTKELPLNNKIQTYGIAAVFLVMLYNSPSGLVLYWTMNNVLSLLKNIFYELKNPLRKLYIIVGGIAVLFIVYILFFNTKIFEKRLLLALAAFLILPAPLYIRAVKWLFHVFLTPLFTANKQRTILFITSSAILAILTGLCIPGAVIASSPEEFSFIDSYQSPFPFVLSSFLRTVGLFSFWPICIYFLFNDKIRTLLAAIFSVGAVMALINTFVFQGGYGMILNTFNFTDVPASSNWMNAINIACLLLALSAIFILLKKNKTRFLLSCMGIILVSLAAFSVYNMVRIDSGYRQFLALRDTNSELREINPVFNLSKDKQNIIVIMSDCAINGLVKTIFAEYPRLETQFDGFTLFPNTVSFAQHTLMGVPPIWGGYEYTPIEINKQTTVPLVEKHNNALLMLPRLLDGAGYAITVTDPSWANYSWAPDTGIYDQYANITAINTIKRYSGLWYARHNFGNGVFISTRIERNAVWFSLLKIAPQVIRSLIYDDGWYWNPEDTGESNAAFIDSYSVLDFLPELTEYNAPRSQAILFTNEATHDLAFLQYPDYIPVETVTDKGPAGFDTERYHINTAFYRKIGQWFVELQKNGVYDNTRIIIVSDHGAAVGNLIADTPIPIPDESREQYNPVLLVKDFNAHGTLKTDMTFMTNADVPVLATDGIIDKPVNPFTGNPITSEPKNNGVYITKNHLPQAMQHNKNTFKIRDDQWMYVHDNILDPNNWEQVKR